MTARCAAVIGSPTCRLPPITAESRFHTCVVCGRVWRSKNEGHGPFWHWDGRTINKRKAVAR